jgi:dihydrodipicolinate synthase/N-acetylneuraminate lyase
MARSNRDGRFAHAIHRAALTLTRGSVKLTGQLLSLSNLPRAMPLSWSDLPVEVLAALRQGAVIPAHPLALDAGRKLDERRQKALTRYYIDAGSGGLAVGVHSTQFAIREVGLYEPVLRLAAETARNWTDSPLVMIAGLSGKTAQARKEAQTARGLGYHAVMLSLASMKGASVDELIGHCTAVAAEMPLVGFYLQTAVGGIPLPMEFWRRFALIENVVGIKMAPFNRYRTLDVIRGVAAAGAEDRVTLYTGNDDHIVLDLVLPFDVPRDGEMVRMRIKGGLLGHWSVWTKSAVELHARIRSAVTANRIDETLLALDAKVTDANSAFFDVANDFAGCIPGCHEVLRRQGLLEGIWCLDPAEKLSPGQKEEIDRVYAAYPEFADDAFVRANLEKWLA